MNNSQRQLLKDYFINTNFSLNLAGRTKCTKNWGTTKHFGNSYTFGYINAGEGAFAVDDTWFYPVSGQFYFLPKNRAHSAKSTNDNYYDLFYAHFIVPPGSIDIFSNFDIPFCISAKNNNEVVELFEKMTKSFYHDDCIQQLAAKGVLYQLLSIFLETSVNEIKYLGADNDFNYLTIREYIDKNLSQELSVEKMSDYFGYNKKYFSKIFKKHLGVFPKKYILEFQIKRAEQLLSNTNMPIKEISNIVGFSGVSYFHTAFKRIMNITPLEYRNSQKSDFFK